MSPKILKTAIKILIPVLVLVLVLVIRYRVVTKDTFSLVKYTTVSITGVDGRGRATAAVDEVGLYAALAGANATADEKNVYYGLVSSIEVSLDRNTELSNDDEILVSVTYSEKEAEACGITVDKTERTQKVTGLVEGSKLDLFSELKIITTGVSPFISVSYVNESENTFLASLSYEISRTSNLSIGDTITITCLTEEETAAAQGYYYDVASMEYTITTADYYLTDATMIPEDVMETILAEDIAAIEEATNDTRSHMSYTLTGSQSYLYRDGNENAVGFAYYGTMIASNSTRSVLEHENYVLIFLKGSLQIPNYNGSEDPYDYIDAYFCFIYNDAIITTDGSFLMATNDAAERYVCSSTYEGCLQEARNRVGAGYSYEELVTMELSHEQE